MKNFLIILLVFLSIGALYGGIGFIIQPDGSFFKMDTSLLKNSVFHNYLVPGLILLTLFGLIPIFVVFCLIKKTNNKILERLNLIKDYHFSWTFTVYLGFALIIWINVQTLILNSVEIIHTIYSSLGMLIIIIALLPSVRINYSK